MDSRLMDLLRRATALGLVEEEVLDFITIKTSVGSSITIFFNLDGEFEYADRSIDGYEYEDDQLDEMLDYLEETMNRPSVQQLTLDDIQALDKV